MMQASPSDIPLSLLMWAAGTLNVLILAGVGIVYRTLGAQGKELLTLRLVLTGEDGTNGIKGDVAALRKWRHEEMVPAQQKNLLRFQRLEDHVRLRPLESE